MKNPPITVLIIAALVIAAAPAMADYYATKQDFLAGKLTPGAPPIPFKAGGDTCTSPPSITPSGNMFNFSDSGDTTGGSSTVAAVPNTCTGTAFDGNASGPDHIWQFQVGSGNQVTFVVTTASTTYDPMMYALSTCGNGLGSCQVGADSCLNRVMEQDDPTGPCQGEATETMVHVFGSPGTYYLYVDSWYSVSGSPTQAQGPYSLMVTGNVPVELLEFTVD